MSVSTTSRNRVPPFRYQISPCNRVHKIGSLLLVAITFIITHLFDQSLSTCKQHTAYSSQVQSATDGIITDSSSGSRRYLEPLTHIKIYVYDENEISGLNELMHGRDGKIRSQDCLRGQWGTQVKIHRLLLCSRYRTRKRNDANLFFVPAYVKCVRMMGGLNDNEINHMYLKVISQMPYFRRSGGRDHIFVFPSGAGAHLFKSWEGYLNRSIFLTPEGHRTDKKDTSAFNTWKDIIIPGNVDDALAGASKVEILPLSRRKYLANYLGRAQGKIGRLKLIELAKQYPDKLESPDLKFKGNEKFGRMEYFHHLRNAKFCLAPRGESSWTLRLYEAFFVECVPVILSDQVELPFQNFIDYRKFSIKWPATRIGPDLLSYLEKIPDGDVQEMIARGRQVRCLWIYAPESEACSAMQGILWELQRKVRLFHQSAETFWLHNQTFVNRDLVEFSLWKPPLPLP